jgi:hypothetical protein
MSICQNFNLKWPDPVRSMFRFQAAITSVSDRIAIIECGFNRNPYFEHFYQKKIIFLLALVVRNTLAPILP